MAQGITVHFSPRKRGHVTGQLLHVAGSALQLVLTTVYSAALTLVAFCAKCPLRLLELSLAWCFWCSGLGHAAPSVIQSLAASWMWQVWGLGGAGGGGTELKPLFAVFLGTRTCPIYYFVLDPLASDLHCRAVSPVVRLPSVCSFQLPPLACTGSPAECGLLPGEPLSRRGLSPPLA